MEVEQRRAWPSPPDPVSVFSGVPGASQVIFIENLLTGGDFGASTGGHPSVITDNVWVDDRPPNINPLPAATSSDGDTSGFVAIYKDRDLIESGIGLAFGRPEKIYLLADLTNPLCSLNRSIPALWGEAELATYQPVLTNAVGDSIPPNQGTGAGWKIRRDMDTVYVWGDAIIASGPFKITFWVFTGQILPDVLSGMEGDHIVTQAGHGFVVGNVIYETGAGWAKAVADGTGKWATHMVTTVTSASIFRIASTEAVTVTAHGLGPAGTVLYLDDTGPGAISSTAPVLRQIVARVIDANTLHLDIRAIPAINKTDDIDPQYPNSCIAVTPATTVVVIRQLAPTAAPATLRCYYDLTNSGGPARTAEITVTIPLSPKLKSLLSVDLIIRTSSTSTAVSSATMDLYDSAGTLDGTLTAASSVVNTDFTITLIPTPSFTTTGNSFRVKITLFAATSSESAFAGRLSIVSDDWDTA